MLSFTSHTPLTQTSAPAAAVHVPLSVGLVWAVSVGTAVPFASCGTHWCIVSLHHLPVAQSASTLHPPEGSQVRFVLQAPERQSVGPSAIVHGPSPLAYPHLLSFVSQTPLAHAAAPAAAVHVPSSVGVCPVTVGTGWPFATFGTHVSVGVLQ